MKMQDHKQNSLLAESREIETILRKSVWQSVEVLSHQVKRLKKNASETEAISPLRQKGLC